MFQIADPSRLRDMRTFIPIPSVVAIDEVEGVYEVAAGQAERHRWIRCCECETDRNHKRGFVLQFVDGTRATVGRDCAREEHSLDFEGHLDAFRSKRSRARGLRQLAAAIETAPDTARLLRALRDDPAVLAALRIGQMLETRLPDLFEKLKASPDGIVRAPAMKRDLDLERLRDERLDRKLDDAARRGGRNREEHGVDQALLNGLRASGDPDASKEPIKSRQVIEVGRYRGAGFLVAPVAARTAATRIESDLLSGLASLNGKETASLSDTQLDGVRRLTTRTLDGAIALCDDVVRALAFVEPSNLDVIAQIASRYKGASGKLVAAGTCLVRETPSRVEVDLALPPTTVSRAPFERAKRRFDEVGSTEDHDG